MSYLIKDDLSINSKLYIQFNPIVSQQWAKKFVNNLLRANWNNLLRLDVLWYDQFQFFHQSYFSRYCQDSHYPNKFSIHHSTTLSFKPSRRMKTNLNWSRTIFISWLQFIIAKAQWILTQHVIASIAPLICNNNYYYPFSVHTAGQ